MSPGYLAATAEAGPGSHRRRVTFLEGHVAHEAPKMFGAASGSIIEQLTAMREVNYTCIRISLSMCVCVCVHICIYMSLHISIHIYREMFGAASGSIIEQLTAMREVYIYICIYV